MAIVVSDRTFGRAVPTGFLGFSFEYQAIRHYTGREPRAVNPVLVQLIRNLTPDQAPVLRIGGDSTDASWWPVAGIRRPAWVRYQLTPGWVGTTAALARALGARLILGVNLAAGSRSIAGTEAKALVRGIGRRHVEALELGNEPEVYGQLPWYRRPGGDPVYARPAWYGTVGLESYARDLQAMRSALPDVPLAGPATGGRRQLADLGRLLSSVPGLDVVTFHRYPANRCHRSVDSPQPATIAGLLSPGASRGLMQGTGTEIALAHRQRAVVRVDELNSVACEGQRGVSDTFASALWAVDALFSIARAGADGVNIHTFPGARYSLFQFGRTRGHWRALVHPEYYGLLLFARAMAPGARLLALSGGSSPSIRAWATKLPDGAVHVVLINDSTSRPWVAQVRVSGHAGPATLERLAAPSISSSLGVSFAGQSFGTANRTGLVGGRWVTAAVRSTGAGYRIAMPAASAALLTIPAG